MPNRASPFPGTRRSPLISAWKKPFFHSGPTRHMNCTLAKAGRGTRACPLPVPCSRVSAKRWRLKVRSPPDVSELARPELCAGPITAKPCRIARACLFRRAKCRLAFRRRDAEKTSNFEIPTRTLCHQGPHGDFPRFRQESDRQHANWSSSPSQRRTIIPRFGRHDLRQSMISGKDAGSRFRRTEVIDERENLQVLTLGGNRHKLRSARPAAVSRGKSAIETPLESSHCG